MKYEKTIKDERGTILICVTLWTDQWGRKDQSGNTFRYDVIIGHKAPRKRNMFFGIIDIATTEEIQAAKLEFWNLIKPL